MVVAKKYYGQNFIHDEKLINKIVSLLGENKNSLIIEIGPGTGALTEKLVNKYEEVIAIEIDKDMESILRKKIPQDNFELIIADALTVDLKNIISKNQKNEVYLISNMPYYITSEILFRTFDLNKFLKKAIFMMQKEVALRICSKVNDPGYNNLSIATQFYTKPKYEFTVNKGMFNPIPKVDSAIVSLEFDDKHLHEIEDQKQFLNFIRDIFNNKRKTILNNLSRVINDKEKALKILNKFEIKVNFRPENLTLENYIKIYNEIF